MANDNSKSTNPSRRFCFTINNPESQLVLSPETHSIIRYCIWQYERAPTTGTPHYQGYLECFKPQRFSAIHKLPGFSTASFRIARGTAEQNVQYCSKDESREDGPWTYGTPGAQGVSDALTAVKRKLDDGATEEEIADDHFDVWVKHRNAFNAYKVLKSEKRSWKTRVVFLYGPPGTGKSSYIREHSPDVHWKSQDKWFDGFSGYSDIALDDFYGWLPYTLMLRLMDRYPYDVEVKGAKIPFAPKVMYISSNKLPHQWWAGSDHYNHDAFYRRVDEIIYMPALGEEIHYFPPGTQIPEGDTFADFHMKVGTFSELSKFQ